MPEPAMRPTDATVDEVLGRIDGRRRAEADALLALHASVSGEAPQVWANRIIGFGVYDYTYDSGHAGRAPILAFASGAKQHTIYLTEDFAERWPAVLERLGTHRASKACLYLTRLEGVDMDALRELLQRSLDDTLERWG